MDPLHLPQVYCQQDATMAQETLLNVLENLTEEEFAKFKFYLKDSGIMGGFNPVKNYQLETRERTVVVPLMVKANKDQGAVEVTKKILEKIPRNDILQNLSAVSSDPTVSMVVPGCVLSVCSVLVVNFTNLCF
ncbi:uncharacterized protein LOC130526036 isoform X3 [Takifugu flavidus]|uniref:uncharacterized protein LOC130526036 isoform X3 n=1 Tax=Takifugu flavidus TaxID=433684 RepID=UPI00254400F2|nr:uncharacterized protein LOC130526036 isoform X3 [Takifugu flavidus]